MHKQPVKKTSRFWRTISVMHECLGDWLVGDRSSRNSLRVNVTEKMRMGDDRGVRMADENGPHYSPYSSHLQASWSWKSCCWRHSWALPHCSESRRQFWGGSPWGGLHWRSILSSYQVNHRNRIHVEKLKLMSELLLVYRLYLLSESWFDNVGRWWWAGDTLRWAGKYSFDNRE